MIQPGTANIKIQRHQPNKVTFEITGYDFSEATIALQVRQYRDAPGDPLISLTNQTAGTEGVSATVATVDGVPVSTVTFRIDKDTIDAVMPFAVTSGVPNRKAGTDVTLVHDIHITGGGLPKTRAFQGSFTIEAGVTV